MERLTSYEADRLNDALYGMDSGGEAQTSVSARFVRTDQDGTTWVRFEGAGKDTPLTSAMSVMARQGDLIDVRLGGYEATGGGNRTDPSAGFHDVRAVNIEVERIRGKQAEFEKLTAREIEAEKAKIGELEADTAKVHDLTADQLTATVGYIEDLTSDNITAANIAADHATVGNLGANYAHITNGVIDNATIGYADVNALDTHYAEIDLANVNNAWVQNGVIKDAAITDAQILGVSANKLTAGTIDAGKINVANLRAKNLIVEKLNGQPVLGGYELVSQNSSGYAQKNPSHEGWYEYSNGVWSASTDTTVDMSKAYYKDGGDVALYDQAYIDGMERTLNQRIDGAVETFTGTAVPSLVNYPAADWSASEYDSHVGDIYYVVNAGGQADGYSYRFTKTGTGSSATYGWTLIRDSDITKALQDILDINGALDIDSIIASDYTVYSFMTHTDGELSNLQTAQSDLETALGTKVSTTTFNDVKQTVDENSATITTHSTVLSNNGLTSTTNITNTVNSVSQTATSNSSTISQLTTTLGTNADGTTKTGDIVSRMSAAEQDLNGFKTTVSETYATQVDLSGVRTTAETANGKAVAYSATGSTGASTAAKVASCTNFPALAAGVTVTVRFSTANTSTGALTLNVNSTGAKTIYVNGSATASTNQLLWATNANITFTYDGTYWRVDSEPRSWYGTCSIAAGTAAKSAVINEAVICKGTNVTLNMSSENTNASATLNITSTGAKNIYYGTTTTRPTTSNGYGWTAASTVTFVFDGAYWRLGDTSALAGLASVKSTVTEHSTSIQQNAEAIALRAYASDVDDLTGRVSTAESTIEQQAGQISAKVSKDGVIAAINLSTEQSGGSAAKIQASKVEIDGTAIFSAISDDVDDAITDKGYQTSTQVENAITSKGYQTASQVSTAVANGTANLAAKADAIARTQRIYYRQTASGTAPGVNNTWLSTSGTGYGNWSLSIPQLTSGETKYPKLYMATQTQTVAQKAAGNACSCSMPALDDSTTIIDGGSIITGSVTANQLNASDINASHSLTIGAMATDTQASILNSNIQVGGRNLFLGTAKSNFWDVASCSNYNGATRNIVDDSDVPGFKVLEITRADSTEVQGVYTYPSLHNTVAGQLEQGETYTLSFLAKASVAGLKINPYHVAEAQEVISSITGSGADYEIPTEWTRYWVTFTCNSPRNAICFYTYGAASCKCWFAALKLEKGNKPTDWTPAPEDVDASISDVESGLTEEINSVSEDADGTANLLQALTDGLSKSNTFSIDEESGEVTFDLDSAMQALKDESAESVSAAKKDLTDRMDARDAYVDEAIEEAAQANLYLHFDEESDGLEIGKNLGGTAGAFRQLMDDQGTHWQYNREDAAYVGVSDEGKGTMFLDEAQVTGRFRIGNYVFLANDAGTRMSLKWIGE